MKAQFPSRTAAVVSALRRIAIGGAVVLLVACSKQSSDEAQKNATGAPPALSVTVQRAELQRVPIALEAVGQTEGSREVEIRSRVSGILEKRLYTEGASVKAGQTLFVIDRAPYKIAVEQAHATLSQERARHEQAQREVDRLKSLAQGKAISQREYDAALSTLKESTAAIEGAQAKLSEAQLNLSYTNVTAPISGITSRAVRSEGSLVPANTDRLTTLTQVNPIWVRFSLAEPDFERIRGNGKSAQVNIVDRDGALAAQGGRLNFSGSGVDPKLGTVPLRAEFRNPDLKWLPGRFVKVQILAGEQNVFLVTQAAVTQTEQARMVWGAGPDGKASMKPVQTANWIGSNWIVTGGLKPGDAVIVDNLMKLRPGAAVQPHAPGAQSQPAGAGGSGAPSSPPEGAPPRAPKTAG
jgi:membrane fusion protein (multidrug efflux system)